MPGEVRVDLADKMTVLKEAIEQTLSAIADGRERVEEIVQSTLLETQRLEADHSELQQAAADAIATVEELSKKSKTARERLAQVNREFRTHSEADMRKAYEYAQQLHGELSQWREREFHLRARRDDLARRLKALRQTARQAETVILKFNHAAHYLNSEFDDVAAVLEMAHEQTVLGLQVLQVQEEEKRLFAQRIHDGPMQSLASLAMLLQVPTPQRETENDSAPTGLAKTRLNDVISELRQVVFDLRPPLLDDLGLVPTLKRYAEQWAQSVEGEIRIHLIGLEAALTPTEKVTVFRSVQEALQNVAEHAAATRVDVTLTYGVGALRVQIVDNGQGIGTVDWQGWLENGKFGLALTRQRIQLLGGSLQILAAEPAGTQFTLDIPLIRGTERDAE
ncbi:sensor histidine kinase [Alicyclobacillus tolerans]|uniref:sensor histidine kinase n=1 Tax=Alicyclobacillus tolerans TaxID=90970 RepID=UPI001F3AB9C8|nr:sensor histidine kinase [Alicyclobacillus tolerans]MCF8566398.1 sensor histidine kinase [Alicyclobacillus tolerans]